MPIIEEALGIGLFTSMEIDNTLAILGRHSQKVSQNMILMFSR